MALGSAWVYWASADTQGQRGYASNSVSLNIPPKSLFAIAALNEFFTNSSGGSGQATIDRYQLRDLPNNKDFPVQDLNSPVYYNGDGNVIFISFMITAYAQAAGSFFSNGANANGTFLVEAWD